MRVLVVKTSSMGDVVHTLPALTDATDALGEIDFDWACEPAFSEIPRWHPSVSDVLTTPFRKWRGRFPRVLFSKEFQAYKCTISDRCYDAVIDAQGLMKSAFLITRFAKGVKHGFNARSVRERFASLAYNKRHGVSKSMHAIERTRHLFACALNYPLPETTPDASIDLGRPFDIENKIVLITQTSRQSKYWPESFWRQIIEDALLQFDTIVLPVGSDSEYEAANLVYGDLPVRILNQFPLTDVACEIAGSRAVVSVDTGLAHISDALSVPLLVLYGPTDPRLVGPIGSKSEIIKSPSIKMDCISPDTAMSWIRALNTGLGE